MKRQQFLILQDISWPHLSGFSDFHFDAHQCRELESTTIEVPLGSVNCPTTDDMVFSFHIFLLCQAVGSNKSIKVS